MTTVVIVPGSFSPAGPYKVFADSLTNHGIQSVVVDMPSVGKREGRPPQTMTDDVNEISRVVLALLDQGKEVIMLMHSYAGVPGSQSLEKLSLKARSAEGKSGGVKKVIYLAAVILTVGQCNLDMLGGNVPDHLKVEDDYMTLVDTLNAPITFSDLPPEEALQRQRQLDVHSTASFKEKFRYAGYNDVEVHYVLCEEDRVIPAEYQSAMIEGINASSGRQVKVHKLKSGHVPTISQPDNLAKIVKAVVEGA